MNPKNKSIVKIGAIGAIPSLIIPFGMFLLGGYAAYYAIKDEVFSTKEERKKAAQNAGLLATAVASAVLIVGIPILLSLVLILAQEDAGYVFFAFIVLSPVLILGGILSSIFGAVSGAFIGNQFEQFGKPSFFIKAGIGAIMISGIGIILSLLLLGMAPVLEIANQILKVNFGDIKSGVYTPDSENFSCNFENTITGGSYSRDGYDPTTGIGFIELKSSVFEESLSYYPLNEAEIKTLTTEKRLGKNSANGDAWIAEKQVEYPDLLLLKDEVLAQEDVIVVAFLPTEHYSGTYTDTENGFLTGSLFFVRGNFSYQIRVSHERDIIVNKENLDFDAVEKEHIEATERIQKYLMEIYDSCTFR